MSYEELGKRQNDNLFDLENIDDLNDDVKTELHIVSTNDEQILNLFKIRNLLTIDEVIVGLARKYQVNRKRSYIINRLYGLSKRRFFNKVKGKKGTYELPRNPR